MISTHNYEAAVAELQQFLDAPKPPPVGSAEAQRFEALLDAIETCEEVLSKASATTSRTGSPQQARPLNK